MKAMITLNGEQIEMDVAVHYMDDEIREAIHEEMAPCPDQQFVDAYVAAHKQKHGEDFTIN
jgi:hypothetical protein